jgi:hypothetical protein
VTSGLYEKYHPLEAGSSEEVRNDKNLVYLLIIGKDRVSGSTRLTGKDTILIY